jgi:photosystem II stability/assembly factor-like uncharacterized protein
LTVKPAFGCIGLIVVILTGCIRFGFDGEQAALSNKQDGPAGSDLSSGGDLPPGGDLYLPPDLDGPLLTDTALSSDASAPDTALPLDASALDTALPQDASTPDSKPPADLLMPPDAPQPTGTWKVLTSGTTANLTDVHFPKDALTGYVVGVGSTLLKTTNGGSSWLSLPGQPAMVSIFFLDNSTGYGIATSSANTYKTTNGGISWSTISTCCGSARKRVHFPSATRGYTGGKSVSYTTTAGVSWYGTYPIAVNATYTDVFATSPTTVFAVTYYTASGQQHGYIHRSTAGGANWAAVFYGANHNLRAIDFPTATTGYAAGYGKMLKSVDSGGSWQLQTVPNVFFTDVEFYGTLTGFAVGYGGEIIKTTNGGAVWTTETKVTTKNLQSLSFPAAGVAFAVGDGGVILKQP